MVFIQYLYLLNAGNERDVLGEGRRGGVAEEVRIFIHFIGGPGGAEAKGR